MLPSIPTYRLKQLIIEVLKEHHDEIPSLQADPDRHLGEFSIVLRVARKLGWVYPEFKHITPLELGEFHEPLVPIIHDLESKSILFRRLLYASDIYYYRIATLSLLWTRYQKETLSNV